MSAELYEGLLMLQHRGQDSAGMVTTDGERFREHRDNGLVREVFGSQALLNMMSGGCLMAWAPVRAALHMLCATSCSLAAATRVVLGSWLGCSSLASSVARLQCHLCRFHELGLQALACACAGQCGLGHVRYPTAGSLSAQEAQPFFVNSPLGIYLIHNGNLTNTDELRDFLNGSQSFYSRHLRTESDSEVCSLLAPGPGLLDCSRTSVRLQAMDCDPGGCSRVAPDGNVQEAARAVQRPMSVPDEASLHLMSS